MPNELAGMRVAILVAKGFEQSELTEPKKALEDAGAEALIISPLPVRTGKGGNIPTGFEVPRRRGAQRCSRCRL